MVSGADGKQESLRIARVHPIARRAAELLPRDRQNPSLRQGRQHGSEAELSFVSR
jgi:hypothetical protein